MGDFELEDSVDIIPQVEAEYTRLTRDYDVNKQQYNLLLSRRAAMRLSSERDASTGEVMFQVIDPPVVPLLPIGPNRIQLASMVLVLGIGCGIALGLVLTIVRPRISEPIELREEFGLTVLGHISDTSVSGGAGLSYTLYGLWFALLLASYLTYVLLLV